MTKKEFNGSEKRAFERLVFSSEDEVVGLFEFSHSPGREVSFKIADISAGGLRFFFPRNNDPIISADDQLVLKTITGKMKLAFITNIEVKVQWVVDHTQFGHMVIGCQFVNLTEQNQTRIDRFVQYELFGKDLEE